LGRKEEGRGGVRLQFRRFMDYTSHKSRTIIACRITIEHNAALIEYSVRSISVCAAIHRLLL
jgi:hypothetical protein